MPFVSSLLCALVGQVRRKQLPPAFHLFTLQAWAATIVELTARILLHYYPSRNNHILYNIYMPFDFVPLFLAAGMIIQRKSRWLEGIGIAIYFLVWIASMKIQGPHTMANFSIMCGTVLLAIRYMQVLITNSSQPSGPMTTGVYFIAISILLYYCCTSPIIGLMHYLIREHRIFVGEVFHVNAVLCVVKYLGTGLGLMIVSKAFYTNREVHV